MKFSEHLALLCEKNIPIVINEGEVSIIKKLHSVVAGIPVYKIILRDRIECLAEFEDIESLNDFAITHQDMIPVCKYCGELIEGDYLQRENCNISSVLCKDCLPKYFDRYFGKDNWHFIKSTDTQVDILCDNDKIIYKHVPAYEDEEGFNQL